VEGLEFEVIKGLSYAIPTLSLEYTSERIGPVIDSIAYLATLRNYEHNYSMVFAHADWVGQSRCPVFYRRSSFPRAGPLATITRDQQMANEALMSL
jgi:hypothetical protein